MLLVTGLAVREQWVQAVIVIIVVVLEGADAGAEDHRKVIGWTQAGGNIGASLAFLLLILAVLREVGDADVALPVKDTARHHGEFAGVPGGAGLA
ncbi:hypothetical protein D3C72_1788660 [compost metagenome]